MPNTETNPGAFNFDDMPGGDLNLDDIFNDTATVTEPVTELQDPGTSVSEPETFLSTTTGTVYKTADEAVKGIEHKDALIADLRKKLSEQTGVDPITARGTETGPQNYHANPKQYFEDIKKATSEEKLVEVQAKFVNDTLAPYAPLLSSLVKSQAVEKVVSEVPKFVEFQKSPEYDKTLEQFPLIKQSIAIAESNPNMAADLAQLYRMAYDVSAGRNLSTIAATRSSTPVTPARPTVSSTTLAPGATTLAPPSLQTSEGRKSIIAAMEAQGIQDRRM
jgi:hypothetical protein